MPDFLTKLNFRIFSALAILLLGIVIALVIPLTSNRLAGSIKDKFWLMILYGLLALIVTPIAAILIAITVIGIPITIILILLYVLAILLSKVFASLYLGKLILKEKKGIIKPMIVGLIAYIILANIPYIGGAVKLLALLLGLGAITMTIFTKKKAKKK